MRPRFLQLSLRKVFGFGSKSDLEGQRRSLWATGDIREYRHLRNISLKAFLLTNIDRLLNDKGFKLNFSPNGLVTSTVANKL